MFVLPLSPTHTLCLGLSQGPRHQTSSSSFRLSEVKRKPTCLSPTLSPSLYYSQSERGGVGGATKGNLNRQGESGRKEQGTQLGSSVPAALIAQSTPLTLNLEQDEGTR